jgi:L-fucose isomerase-like protein
MVGAGGKGDAQREREESAMSGKLTLGLIVGNRGFFPDQLAKEGREEMERILRTAGVEVVAVGAGETKHGAIETRAEARRCADLFRSKTREIDGVVVTLPNFGDERAVADTLRLSGLQVPVLIHAYPDAASQMTIRHRRDSFCGKMSVCNNLRQYGIPYSLTRLHTVAPDSDDFRRDLEWFGGVCRIVRGLDNVRIGAIGARPAAFNTVRYSEKLLEASGISVETVDLSEILGRIGKRSDGDPAVEAKIEAIRGYVETRGVPGEALTRMAKLAVVVEEWMRETEVSMSAVQCWTAIEEYYGVVPCTMMSMMSDSLLPSACEVDICGAVAMYALQQASGTPSALLDWNNNYGDDPDKTVCFHCSNLPKHFFQDFVMDFQEIIAGSVGKESTFGTVVGRVKPGPMTFARISTDDEAGTIAGYVGHGRFTEDPLETFGGYGVAEIPNLQELLHFICENGFEHHVAANLSSVAGIFHEAATKYLDWDVYLHD